MEKQKNNSKYIFKNTTINDTNSYKIFLEFHNDRNLLKHNLYTIFISILLIFCFVLNYKNSNYLLGLFFTFTFLFFIFFRVFKPILIIKKEVKSKKLNTGFKNTYFFYDNYFVIKNYKGRTEIKYFRTYKIFETPLFFYIYTDKDNAYLLSKDGFSDNTLIKFKDFIKKKYLFKYYNYSKSTKHNIDINKIIN